jgi:hypothetical protein
MEAGLAAEWGPWSCANVEREKTAHNKNVVKVLIRLSSRLLDYFEKPRGIADAGDARHPAFGTVFMIYL